MKGHRLGHRFFLLTGLGYLVALISCAVIVWILSAPFLRDAHTERLEDLAKQQASAASFMLDEIYDRTEYLAPLPLIQDLISGTHNDVTAVSDHIATFRTDSIKHVKLLDFEGMVLYETSFSGGHARLFSDVEYREGFTGIKRIPNGANRPGRVMLRTNREDGYSHILIAVPIMLEGIMQGAVVIEEHLDLAVVLPGGSRLITSFQQQLADTSGSVITAPVPGMPLHVIVADQIALDTTAKTQTSTLVSRISLGLAFVLLVPFLAMSLFGQRLLVEPTKALSISREKLQLQETTLKQQSEELRELAMVAEMSRDAVIVTDRDSRIVWVNKAFTGLTGYSAEEAIGQIPGHLLQDEKTDQNAVARIRAALAAGTSAREELQNVSKFGRRYWVALSISPIADENGNVLRFAAISSDITARRQAQEDLARAQKETEFRANHDALTDLPNRRFLDQVLETQVTRDAVPRTLIRVDLDFFKNVNDTHGHAAGDHVLKVVSDILIKHCRKGDLVTRVGGDEFVVLLKEAATTAEADTLCERFRSEICKDIAFDGQTCRVGASFGVASALDGLVDNNNLLVGADAALYVSKAKGRNTTTLYSPEVHADVINKRRSAAEIERAIEHQEFEPYFQPQMDAITRQLTGIEALVRWNHPKQGVLAPAAFLPLAEQLSLVPDIDDIVYTKGLEAVHGLNADGYLIPKVSFNVGAKQLENPLLRTIHKRIDLGPTRVAFEVLESVLVEEQDNVFAFQIDLLRDLGFGIEVDDFGSGHASIVGLLKLCPDVMKLDQRLVMPIDRDPRAITTVRALVEIGRSQGIKITAEGVETEQHAKILADLGVNTLQGYLFARPMPVETLRAFLSDQEEVQSIA
jgi:diguanylate cyclase (GGDEF)-like protein/PAS domain S-box-containing protein